MIDIGKDIIFMWNKNKWTGRIEAYLGAGQYLVYLYQDARKVEINCKDILEVFEI